MNRALSGRVTRVGTTPFPNALLDEAMPCLKDTEWRILCVIVRQTLGWQDSRNKSRKTSDWLTQAQLVKKTGRDRAALSRALNSLVKHQYIEVRTEKGRLLLTPEERRHCKGRLFFGLHPRFYQRYNLKSQFSYQSTSQFASQPAKSEYQPPISNSLLDDQPAKSEYHRASKANITKETHTKETDTKSIHQDSLGRLMVHVFESEPSKTNNSSVQELLPYTRAKDSNSTREFIALFTEIAEAHKIEADTALREPDVLRLKNLLAAHPALQWKSALQQFFESDATYVVRHNHSLFAFLNSCHIFLAKNNSLKKGIKPGFQN